MPLAKAPQGGPATCWYPAHWCSKRKFRRELRPQHRIHRGGTPRLQYPQQLSSRASDSFPLRDAITVRGKIPRYEAFALVGPRSGKLWGVRRSLWVIIFHSMSRFHAREGLEVLVICDSSHERGYGFPNWHSVATFIAGRFDFTFWCVCRCALLP